MAHKKIVHVQTAPQAYVMPEEPELSDEEIDALPLEEQDRYLDRLSAKRMRRLGSVHHHYDTDSFQDAIELEAMELDDEPAYRASEVEKAAAPLIWKAEHRDLLQQVPHDAPADAVDLNGDREVTQLLVVAVAYEVGRWKKPPRSEVTAAAIGLALAHVRKESGVKHPRDIAKEVGVRPQTLFKIRKIALAEIDRLAIADVLRDGGEFDGNL